jgi:hypothetical protein
MRAVAICRQSRRISRTHSALTYRPFSLTAQPRRLTGGLCELQPGNPATSVPALAINAIAYLCNVSLTAMNAARGVVEKSRLVTPDLLSRADFADVM